MDAVDRVDAGALQRALGTVVDTGDAGGDMTAEAETLR